MRAAFLLFFILVLSSFIKRHNSNSINLDKALGLAKLNGKKLVFVSALNGCSPCSRLHREFKENDTLIEVFKKYEVVLSSGSLKNLSLVNKIYDVLYLI
ncbi:hypothetical protein [Pedobacter sp. MW01-1-1]|uniref:hypothetical protein n=1 Tax=Pedobacter sp. MW01-1-1 TaxID=3383027 RepID=UPI003FED67AE